MYVADGSYVINRFTQYGFSFVHSTFLTICLPVAGVYASLLWDWEHAKVPAAATDIYFVQMNLARRNYKLNVI